MEASQIMTREVATVPETASVADALEILEQLRIRHLPVVDDEGEVVGMISDRDLRGVGLDLVHDVESFERVRARLRAGVAGLMSADVLTIGPETDVGEVVDRMIEEQIGALPVVDEDTNELLGIVSYVDVLRVARDRLG